MNEDILQNINRRIDDTLEYSRKLVEDDKVVERFDELKLRSENYIRENPIKSVAIGLFTGYILGKIFSSD